jgi:hypothetical protein
MLCVICDCNYFIDEICYSLFFDTFLRQILITMQPQSERASIFRTYLLLWDANVTADTAHVSLFLSFFLSFFLH